MQTVNPQALGHAVRIRRAELDFNQTEVAKRAGLSLTTISAIERGLADKLRPTSLNALDRALRWEEGTAALHYSGLATVRQAIRSFGGKPPKGDEYRDLLVALARMTDSDIAEIAAIIDARRLELARQRDMPNSA